MTNSIKISPQRTSFILSANVILYWATDSYLYLNCHIDIMEYSTPVILYITAMILACGVLKRFFFRFITTCVFITIEQPKLIRNIRV